MIIIFSTTDSWSIDFGVQSVISYLLGGAAYYFAKSKNKYPKTLRVFGTLLILWGVYLALGAFVLRNLTF